VERECRIAFRVGLYFIVITVTAVTFPYLCGFCVTVLVQNPRDRHFIVMATVIEENSLGKRFPRQDDDDDGSDGGLRAFSNTGVDSAQ
jgi:hypothetical protein